MCRRWSRPLRLVSNRLTILARVRARLQERTLTLDGWLPDAGSVAGVVGLLSGLRPDLEIAAEGLRDSVYVRWPEGEKLPLSGASALLKPIVEALRVAPVLEIEREETRLVVKGLLPEAGLKAGIMSALGQGMHGLRVDAEGLGVTTHALSVPFVQGNVLLPFLRSYYSTPSPGSFKITQKDGPRLTAPATRTLESAWLTLLRPVSGGARVDMRLTLYPSIYHFPGRRVETPLAEDVLIPLREGLRGQFVSFALGSSTLGADEQARLAALLPLLLEAGPLLRLIVGGHPDPEGVPTVEGRLALARAEKVVSWLVEQGTPAADIQAVAFDPVLAGSDGAPAATRSVELLIR